MNCRIKNAFENAKSKGRGAFVAYLTIGYPTVEASEAAADALVAGGADILEIGVPFSDPFADGGVIRKAAYRALEGGMTLAGAIAAAGRIRERHPETGIVLFSYYNPIFSYGLEKFADDVAAAGVDAVLAVDLPLEERGELQEPLAKRGVSIVPLIAPNTPMERIVASAEGLENTFLYIITVKGTTGARTSLPEELPLRLDAIRRSVSLPIAAGFGISTQKQAEEVSAHADGFVVGSAIVKKLADGGELKGKILD